jgi:hypothetical protein
MNYCEPAEAALRVSSGTLSIFEKDSNGSARLDRIVSAYARPAAGTVPRCGRDPTQLLMTVEYLVEHVLDLDTQGPKDYCLTSGTSVHSFVEIYRFVSDRFRAIVMSLRVLSATATAAGLTCIKLIVKFHVLCIPELGVALRQGLASAADVADNARRLHDTLGLLLELVPGDFQGHEEYLAYALAVYCPDAVKTAQLLTASVKTDCQLTQRAVKAALAYNSSLYATYLRQMTPRDLLSCALCLHLSVLAGNTKQIVHKAYHQPSSKGMYSWLESLENSPEVRPEGLLRKEFLRLSS